MNPLSVAVQRQGALLAINVLFLIVWGFAGFSKVQTGVPGYFPEKFGGTFLASFPGLSATFWLLTISELAGFVMAAVALVRLEFLAARPAQWLGLTLVWSLMIFLQLSLGQWLTSDFNATFQLFTYFCGTLVALHYTHAGPAAVVAVR